MLILKTISRRHKSMEKLPSMQRDKWHIFTFQFKYRYTFLRLLFIWNNEDDKQFQYSFPTLNFQTYIVNFDWNRREAIPFNIHKMQAYIVNTVWNRRCREAISFNIPMIQAYIVNTDWNRRCRETIPFIIHKKQALFTRYRRILLILIGIAPAERRFHLISTRYKR